MTKNTISLCAAVLTAFAFVGCAASDETDLASTDEALSSGRIRVYRATYGGNAGAWSGNATSSVASECDYRSTCRYLVSTDVLGDPVPGVTKDFRVDYACGGGALRSEYIEPEANGWQVVLSCDDWQPDPRRIHVRRATYGGNAGAPLGNATRALGSACDRSTSCDYYISVHELGDPAPLRPKDFQVEWTCGNDGAVRRASVRPEASGQNVRLTCW
jgi:hypothetical protein